MFSKLLESCKGEPSDNVCSGIIWANSAVSSVWVSEKTSWGNPKPSVCSGESCAIVAVSFCDSMFSAISISEGLPCDVVSTGWIKFSATSVSLIWPDSSTGKPSVSETIGPTPSNSWLEPAISLFSISGITSEGIPSVLAAIGAILLGPSCSIISDWIIPSEGLLSRIVSSGATSSIALISVFSSATWEIKSVFSSGNPASNSASGAISKFSFWISSLFKSDSSIKIWDGAPLITVCSGTSGCNSMGDTGNWLSTMTSSGVALFAVPSKYSDDICCVSKLSSETWFCVFGTASEGIPILFASKSSGGIRSGLASDCILFMVSWFKACASLILSELVNFTVFSEADNSFFKTILFLSTTFSRSIFFLMAMYIQ